MDTSNNTTNKTWQNKHKITKQQHTLSKRKTNLFWWNHGKPSKTRIRKTKKLAQRIARYFKQKYGIEEDPIDYYALVDTNLTFKENIKNIKRILNKAEKVRKARDELIKQNGI